MATVTKRVLKNKNGEFIRWVAWYKDQNGRRRNKTFAKQKEARTWLNRTVIEVADEVHTPASDSITVAEAGELWISKARSDGLERSTVEQYRSHLDRHIKPFIGRIKLAELNPAHLQRLRDRLTEDGRTRDMVKRVVISLGAILGTAIIHGKLARNIVRDQARNGSRQREQRLAERHEKKLEVAVDIPTKDEIRVMLNTATGRVRAMLVTVTFTGLRASELRGLKWNDIDWDAEVLRVRQRADRWNTLGSPKAKASRRTIPLAPIVVNTLKEWWLACPKGPANLVFPTVAGGIANITTLHRTILGPLQLAVGITSLAAVRAQHPELSEKGAIRFAHRAPKYGFHAFRHAAASLFIEEGWTAKKLMTVMGHSSIQMTYDIYGHLFPDAEGDKAAMHRLQVRLLG